MTTARPSLAADERTLSGKAVQRLRRDGRLPAVVFGHGISSQSVSLDAHEFELLQKHTGANALIDLRVGGGRPRAVLVHGVQVHPVTRRPLHVDLFAVRMTEEITVDVRVVTVGESYAVEKLGGTMVHGLGSVKVRALPDHLPNVLELPVDGLDDFEKVLYVSDLVVPAGVTLLTDPHESLAHVVPPRVEEAPAVAVEEVEPGAPTEPAGGAGTGEAESAEE